MYPVPVPPTTEVIDMRRYWIFVLGVLVLVSTAYLVMSRFVFGSRAQRLAVSRVTQCAAKFPGVRVVDVFADGQVWLSFDPNTDVNAVRECLKIAAAEQSRQIGVIKAPEEISGTVAVFGFPVKPEVTFGDLGTLAAAGIAIVAGTLALFQLVVMSRQARTDIILTIDDRWEASKDTMGEVRDAIIEFYRDALQTGQAAWPGLNEAERQRLVETELLPWLLAELYVGQPKKYRTLCRGLGFFETVGHAVQNRYLTVSEVTNLFGGTILQFDQLFGAHIRQLQTLRPHLYENVSKLTRRVETHRRWEERMKAFVD
jgi:hypothetical protein